MKEFFGVLSRLRQKDSQPRMLSKFAKRLVRFFATRLRGETSALRLLKTPPNSSPKPSISSGIRVEPISGEHPLRISSSSVFRRRLAFLRRLLRDETYIYEVAFSSRIAPSLRADYIRPPFALCIRTNARKRALLFAINLLAYESGSLRVPCREAHFHILQGQACVEL